MKKISIVIFIVLVCNISFGLYAKNTYKDCGVAAFNTVDEALGLNPNINQIFTEDDVDLFISDIKKRIDTIADDVLVLVVQPTGKMKQYGFSSVQEVSILSVLRGDVSTENSIEIASIGGGGVYSQEYAYYDYSNERPVLFGMVNVLLPEKEYLVFLTPLKLNSITTSPYYRYAWSPQSSFRISDDYSVAVNKTASDTSYEEFKGSEFFCDTEETVNKLLQLKHTVVARYLANP
ncbi:MAG: hypothetical protein LBQ15_01315 [Clostridium sp.]|jgi:hypothetical protein|nr:hypothetical protein [Clostridium sp.]